MPAPKQQPEEKLPRIIHYVWIGSGGPIPDSYLFGDPRYPKNPLREIRKACVRKGFIGVLQKAQKEGYEVHVWTDDDTKPFEAALARGARTAYALVDSGRLVPNSIKFHSISELAWLDGGTNSLIRQLLHYAEIERCHNHNLAAASNIYRMLILAFIGGMYCDLSKGMYRAMQSRYDVTLKLEKSTDWLSVNSMAKYTLDEMRKIVIEQHRGFARLHVGNYVMVSEPQHPVMLKCLALTLANYERIYRHEYQSRRRLKEGKKPLSMTYLIYRNGRYATQSFEFPVTDYLRSREYRVASTEAVSGIHMIAQAIYAHEEKLEQAEAMPSLYEVLNWHKESFEGKYSLLSTQSPFLSAKIPVTFPLRHYQWQRANTNTDLSIATSDSILARYQSSCVKRRRSMIRRAQTLADKKRFIL